MLDDYICQALAEEVRTRTGSDDILDALLDRFLRQGKPAFAQNDNGPDVASDITRKWRRTVGVTSAQVYVGSPWHKGINEGFNGTLRRERLNAEWFATTRRAQTVSNCVVGECIHTTAIQSSTLLAVNSAPSSDLMSSGVPRMRYWSLKASTASKKGSFRFARIASASYVNSSLAIAPREAEAEELMRYRKANRDAGIPFVRSEISRHGKTVIYSTKKQTDDVNKPWGRL